MIIIAFYVDNFMKFLFLFKHFYVEGLEYYEFLILILTLCFSLRIFFENSLHLTISVCHNISLLHIFLEPKRKFLIPQNSFSFVRFLSNFCPLILEKILSLEISYNKIFFENF